MTDQENTFIALDSLCANEFEVEVNGEKANGVFRISGLALFGDSDSTMLITKMVQRDGNLPLNKWIRETMSNPDAARTVAIIAVDDGVEARRWILEGARLVSVTYSDFSSTSTEMIEECLTVSYERVGVQWSANSNLE